MKAAECFAFITRSFNPYFLQEKEPSEYKEKVKGERGNDTF